MNSYEKAALSQRSLESYPHLDEDQDHSHITLDVTKLPIRYPGNIYSLNICSCEGRTPSRAQYSHLHEEVTRSLLGILEHMQQTTSKALRSCLNIPTRCLNMSLLSQRLDFY